MASPASLGSSVFRLGVERLFEDPDEFARLAGKRVGLITNPTGADALLRHTVDRLCAGQRGGGYTLAALYAPEHGILGGAPAGADIPSHRDARTGLTVWSLYGETQRPTPRMLSEVDVLLFDLQDVGVRFYTYIWTLYLAMAAAGECDVEVIVLDRPNPLGDRMDGPVLEPALASFVGLREIPLRHGLTVGELARLFAGEFLARPPALHVVRMSGYDPARHLDGYGLPWVPPSPNLPTRESAWAYPGTGLIEALDASEGRGTTVPFLWAGHSCLDEVAAVALADELNARELPGVLLRAMMTTPAAGKQSGLVCGGVQLHVTAPDAFDGLRTGLHLVQALAARPGVGWREETDLLPSGGGKAETVPWIDRLTGTADVRRSLAAGIAPETIAAGWGDGLATFRERAQPHRLYALPPLPSADRPAQSGGGTIPG